MSRVKTKMLYSDKPHSVSAGAWPLLSALGEERKTRVFATQGYFDASEGDNIVEAHPVGIFDKVAERVVDEKLHGLFTLRGDKTNTQYILTGRDIGWFYPAAPGKIHYSDEGMIPFNCRLPVVLIDQEQGNFAYEIAQKSMSRVAEGKDSPFAAESTLIRRLHEYAVHGMSPTSAFRSLGQLAQILQMPRAKAYAQQELDLVRFKGKGMYKHPDVL